MKSLFAVSLFTFNSKRHEWWPKKKVWLKPEWRTRGKLLKNGRFELLFSISYTFIHIRWLTVDVCLIIVFFYIPLSVGYRIFESKFDAVIKVPGQKVSVPEVSVKLMKCVCMCLGSLRLSLREERLQSNALSLNN